MERQQRPAPVLITNAASNTTYDTTEENPIMSNTETARSITDLRRALIAESDECAQLRQQFREPMKNGDQSALDAYEGLVGTGTYAWLVAGILRRLEQQHPETAAVVAQWVEASLDSGVDWLENLNDDLDTTVDGDVQAVKAGV